MLAFLYCKKAWLFGSMQNPGPRQPSQHERELVSTSIFGVVSTSNEMIFVPVQSPKEEKRGETLLFFLLLDILLFSSGCTESIRFDCRFTLLIAVLPPCHYYSLPGINPFRTAVPFWGQTTQFTSSLPPKRNCGPKRVKGIYHQLPSSIPSSLYRVADRHHSRL